MFLRLPEPPACPGCWGAGDSPHKACAACGQPAVVAVACEGWRPLNVLDQPADHSVSWCARCWREVQQVRPQRAPALNAVALTRAGRRLLEATPAAPAVSRPTLWDWLSMSSA
jgi:hypothetical protein